MVATGFGALAVETASAYWPVRLLAKLLTSRK